MTPARRLPLLPAVLALSVLSLAQGAGWAGQATRPQAADRFVDESAVREALGRIFPAADDSLRIDPAPVIMEPELRREIASAAGSAFPDDTLRVFVCRRGVALAGYGILDNVRGKSREITYLLALTPAGETAAVEVLRYRESHGGEVSGKAFTDQFRGKKVGDRLTAGRDIRTISGATISSRSLTAGVSRLLAAYSRVKDRLPR